MATNNQHAVVRKDGRGDTLSKLMHDLCHRLPTAAKVGETTLSMHVSAEARDLSGESLSRYMNDLYGRIFSMMSSPDPAEKLGGIYAIDELIDVQLGENAAKFSRFANYLRELPFAIGTPCDTAIVNASVDTLGHLVRTGGALTADVVEFEVKRALEWLETERSEMRRYGATIILAKMADNAPTVFNVHVPGFIGTIWFGLRDAKISIRERACAALRACLLVVEKRETRYRVQWYYKLFEETMKGLGKGSSVESVHGSLLAVGELLGHSGEFMLARYKEVVETVLRFRDHREKIIRNCVTSNIPWLATFAPERFACAYLGTCMVHLQNVLRNASSVERGIGFTALGLLSKSMTSARGVAGLAPHLQPVASAMKELFAKRKKSTPGWNEAIVCAGQIAQHLGAPWEQHAQELVDPLFHTGLTAAMVATLAQFSKSLGPAVKAGVRDRLLETIHVALVRRPYRALQGPVAEAARAACTLSSPGDAREQEQLAILALHTLATFDLDHPQILNFMAECAVPYLENDSAAIRKEAALACVHLLQRRGGAGGSGRRMRVGVEEVLDKLLVVAVADPEPEARQVMMRALCDARGHCFDSHLAQADSLRALFIGLNDQVNAVCATTIQLVGRLSHRNPAYVLPALRRHLLQLLQELDHSADAQPKEESARLLGVLIQSCPRLVLPYVSPILKALVKKLRTHGVAAAPAQPPQSQQQQQPSSSASMAMVAGAASTGGGASGAKAGKMCGRHLQVSVLSTIGQLAKVSGATMRLYMRELLPLLLDALKDGTTAHKRVVAVGTLGQLVQSSGYVIAPYVDYPSLMGILLRLLNEPEGTRTEVLKTLGIIGALDPHTHKLNQFSLQWGQGEGQLSADGVRGQPQRPHEGAHHPPDSGSMEAHSLDMLGGAPEGGPATSSEEYYPTVAINALMRVLRDGSVSSHHHMVVRSLMFIFKALGLGCVAYLPKVMPLLFHVVRTGEDPLKDFLFHKLTSLVAIIRQHIRKYLDELLELVYENWGRKQLLPRLLLLLQMLSRALHDEFRVYMPDILPRCVGALAEAERLGDYDSVHGVLKALEIFSSSLEEHLHLVLPAMVRLFQPGVADVPLVVRREAMQSLRRLLPKMQLTGYASAIVHPLARCLDSQHDDLRKEAADVVAVLGDALGPDLAIFLPLLRKTMARHKMHHPKFEEVAARMLERAPYVEGPNGGTHLHAYAASSANSDAASNADAEDQLIPAFTPLQPLKVNELCLKRAWESSQRSTKEDWEEWMRNLSVELLKESPSPALRACHQLAQLQPHVARELFAAGFVSCWSELHDTYQEQLVRSLEAAFASPTIPPEIIASLLNLAEFMEHDEKPLPVDIRTLGALAEKCRAYAKALHYKEQEFQQQPANTVEALISINNQLQQPEAAVGMLVYAQQHLNVELKESWYEKLQRWDEALEAYRRKRAAAESASTAATAVPFALGEMRCLHAMAEWEPLARLANDFWPRVDTQTKIQMAPLAAHAAWNMGLWEHMDEFVSYIDSSGSSGSAPAGKVALGSLSLNSSVTSLDASGSLGAFFRAVLHVHNGRYREAAEEGKRARHLLGTELSALVGESYERAYAAMVRVQQLTELEEVLAYNRLGQQVQLGVGNVQDAEDRRGLMRQMWRDRIRGVQRKVEVWQGLLAVRSLVLPMKEESEAWTKFASLLQKSGRTRQSNRTLLQLLGYDPLQIRDSSQAGFGAGSGAPNVMLAYLKHLWTTGDSGMRHEAFARIQTLVLELQTTVGTGQAVITGWDPVQSAQLVARAYLKLGTWQWGLCDEVDDQVIADVLASLRAATEYGRSWGKAWHHWALFNAAAMEHYAKTCPAQAIRHVAPAVSGFFRSIALEGTTKRRGGCLQDILRLLTLWFNHGAAAEVEKALEEGFQHVSIDTWLVVIPQIIARIHSPSPPVRNLIHSLLIRIGRHHPQALLYPLLVACKSQSAARRAAAMSVVDHLRQHSPVLVEQAQLVSQELIRVAILWHEMWHEALEEASRMYFGEQNVEGMLNVLAPLHALMERQGAETLQEISFMQAYGRELSEAHDWCNKYRRSQREAELNQAWDLYYHVFKRINKQLPHLTTLDLGYVSPLLVSARGLELAVPGTYIPGEKLVTIAAFAPTLQVITSKQRPRKLNVNGGDLSTYGFLLKGHEDLRQDERVMQLFTLVNTLLANNRQTAERDLSIGRYAVVPLSPNSGLIGWVPNCDTLHALIREHRDARKVPLNLEHRLMLTFAPDYDHLMLIGKVEVFQHAVENTPGDDLHKVLWLKSSSSEVWLNRRTNFTRSLAMMSMVGYLLGLGDRHPSNLMLDRYSGKLLHIDFGDCFEASMNREKFPEKVPFRLTRMLVKAMEVSGIEGNFRSTCCSVMQVLRSNKDSVMAMLEAFVHDPLINWRLLNTTETHPRPANETAGVLHTAARQEEGGFVDPEERARRSNEYAAGTRASVPQQRGARERDLLAAVGQLGDANEVLNERAVAVMKRMSHKLTGRDYTPPGGTINSGESPDSVSVEAQVQHLILQATSDENLCQSYIGWCPFW